MSGGSGDVEIDISGDITVPSTPLTSSAKPGCSGPEESSDSEVANLFNLDKTNHESGVLKKFLMQIPAQIQMASPAAREWLSRSRENVKPWLVFLNTQKFKVPPTIPRWSKRLARNIDYFQSNYIFVFAGLILYCLITSPFLLLAVGASLGACYILSLKNAERKIVVGGHELSLLHQYAAIGVLSLPIFYIAGAGSALFWVLGASFFIILIHASLYNVESLVGSDEEPFDLQMEQV